MNDDSDGENSDGRAKASGDANSEHEKIGYFDAVKCTNLSNNF